MASTALVGNDGSITMPTGHNAVINAWTGSISQVVSETTGFSDSFRNYRGGVMGMRWTASGLPKADAATHSPLPDSTDTLAMDVAGATITLTVAEAVSGASSYAGSAIIESLDISVNKLGESTLNYSGVISGTITQTWDET